MKKIKISCIGNFPPRQCGIATFTRDLIESIIENKKEKKIKAEAYIIAMNDPNQTYNYPEEVKFEIRQEHQRDYLKAAKFINYSDANICVLQHEFGIFGGDRGIYILPLIHRLKIPLIVTFHTVLENPSYNEKVIIQEISNKAEKVVVMSNLAVDFLTKIYNVPQEKIELIEHGVPDFNFVLRKKYKKKLNLENKRSLLTFGLLSRDKGIETVINALPKVIKNHPDIIYIILGKTHPGVVRVSGEEYRNSLKHLVEKNKLRKNVYFYDSYVSNEKIFEYLSAIDIYITPYLNKAQITSGTLSYAIGAGTAVVSTPYWHAKELLADKRGRLFDFGDSDALADILIELLDKPSELPEMRKKAYKYGRETIWPKVGSKYFKLLSKILNSRINLKLKEEPIINPLVLPKFSLLHIRRLTDDTGIIQHAKYNIPNLKSGYTLDDNARALLLCLMAYKQKKDPIALDLLPVYLSYIYYMQNGDGTFRNLLSFSRGFLDKKGSEDSFGRTIWALGFLIRFTKNDTYFQISKEMFAKAFKNFKKLKSIRGMANTVIGICHYLHRFLSDEEMNKVLRDITYNIIDKYEKERRKDWNWFESIMTYDNGIIPAALFSAYKLINDDKILIVAKESMEFLEKIISNEGYISLIGNNGWYKRGKTRSRYAQQPVDAAATVLMFYQAFIATKDNKYIDKLFTSFMWFLGENDLRTPLYDFETRGCNDGLESHGVNRNQGAESTISYLISHLTVLQAFERFI